MVAAFQFTSAELGGQTKGGKVIEGSGFLAAGIAAATFEWDGEMNDEPRSFVPRDAYPRNDRSMGVHLCVVAERILSIRIVLSRPFLRLQSISETQTAPPAFETVIFKRLSQI